MVSLSLTAILLLSVPDMREMRPVDGSSVGAAMHHVFERPPQYAQVRIEKRVIIRVPRRLASPLAPMADFSQERARQTYREKKIGKCLPMTNILGVQMFEDRYLDLVTKDRKRIRAQLEDKCQARSFYSGFYVEKTKDGKMCAGRDILHSRTGAKCEIERFRELVPER
ncbi:MAG: hypothetical protein GW808_09400 [Sphingomonadales bacterium]|nr:hypothetical protein [Sphingomonadales bacterium]NCO49280.1 hypothetical protein [Sphingomonadales bacterium]NCO99452.1 hypothetical protein [Sphingomonadales bacterium]NCP27838.1 hypothetical protein [Sphingomonadales bacterium]NCP43014.1 hypothetical protein [Sphingomonadales bacterium]